MTRSDFDMMIKRAKSSAKDKATMAALMAGTPTSTGVAAGASLATILAAMGVAARSGDGPDEHSVLSNPVLLGALGAAGGYLGGNALSNAPTRRSMQEREMSDTALLSILGGTLGIGSALAREDAVREYRNLARQMSRRTSLSPDMAANLDDIHLRLGGEGVKKLLALKRNHPSLTAYEAPKSIAGKFWEWFKHSPSSPKSVAQALNPWKTLRFAAGKPGGPKYLGKQLVKLLKDRNTARLALAAIAFGGGKAIYDYAHD